MVLFVLQFEQIFKPSKLVLKVVDFVFVTDLHFLKFPVQHAFPLMFHHFAHLVELYFFHVFGVF